MSTAEKVEALLSDVLPRVEEIAGEARAKIREVREDASAKIARHGAASTELAKAEDRIDALLDEKEGLVLAHSEAALEDDVDEELRIKQRYQDIGAEVEELEGRSSVLRDEISELVPNSHGHPYDARIHHVARVAMAANNEREALERLRDGIVEALDAALKPVVDTHEQTRALVSSWGQQVDRELRQRERIGTS